MLDKNVIKKVSKKMGGNFSFLCMKNCWNEIKDFFHFLMKDADKWLCRRDSLDFFVLGDFCL